MGGSLTDVNSLSFLNQEVEDIEHGGGEWKQNSGRISSSALGIGNISWRFPVPGLPRFLGAELSARWAGLTRHLSDLGK